MHRTRTLYFGVVVGVVGVVGVLGVRVGLKGDNVLGERSLGRTPACPGVKSCCQPKKIIPMKYNSNDTTSSNLNL